MTESNVFFILNQAITKAMKENAVDTSEYLRSELSKLPKTLKIFVVSKGNGLDEILCQSRTMAEELWKNNKEFKYLYFFNPMGDCTTIKQRK